MCLIAWNWCPDQPEPLVLIANRDEQHNRPAQPLHRWPDEPIWAGKDLQAGGTWLGVTATGRLAAVTNFRTHPTRSATVGSRGHLVTHFLRSSLSGEAFVERLAKEFAQYAPFNLLVFDGQHLLGFEGREDSGRPVVIPPGRGSVSNGDFSSTWHKQTLICEQMAQVPLGQSHSDVALLDVLMNPTPAPLATLPHTGVSLETELALSAVFVRLPNYGTRAASLVRYRPDSLLFVERTFVQHALESEVRESIAWV